MLIIGLINELERLGVTRFICKTDGRQDINTAFRLCWKKKQKLSLEIISEQHLIYSSDAAHYLYCCKHLRMRFSLKLNLTTAVDEGGLNQTLRTLQHCAR